jgi:hypothetical protein
MPVGINPRTRGQFQEGKNGGGGVEEEAHAGGAELRHEDVGAFFPKRLGVRMCVCTCVCV